MHCSDIQLDDFFMPERIIVSLTTWSARVDNVPTVLDTIFAQTLPPDLVVLNVAYDLEISQTVQNYLDQHHVEIYRCPDTKVYKKLIHTLKRYPDDCVISIDDDWLYPNEMIADFIDVHRKYPAYPISGNRVVLYGMQCHCGCASLSKFEYFGEYLDIIDDDLMKNCPSDDLVYTYMANKNGHPYLRTKNEYFENMESYNSHQSYSDNSDYTPINQTYDFLTERFGLQVPRIRQYVKDERIALLLEDIEKANLAEICRKEVMCAEKKIKQSYAYRLGKFILKPFSLVRRLLKNKL